MRRRLAMTMLAGLLLLGLAPTANAASPGATTRAARAIATDAATLRATVNPQGLPTTYSFEYGTTTAYGAQTAIQSAGSGSGGRAVSVRISGLVPGARYHFRVVATNADGTTVGADRTFVTRLPPASPPAVLGTAPFSPRANRVNLTALLNPGGAPTTYRFQFGTTTSYGLETFSRTLPASSVPQSVSIPVDGLQARTTYHFRVVASNRAGTTTGPDVTFRTGPFPPGRLVAGSRPTVQRRSHPWFIVQGVLRLPIGVSVEDGCRGTIGVRFTSRDDVVKRIQKRLDPGHCSYHIRVRALPPRGRDKLRVHVRFGGNATLTPVEARSFLVGFRDG